MPWHYNISIRTFLVGIDIWNAEIGNVLWQKF